NLRYPDEARLKGISGISYVRFTVNEDGSLSGLTLKKGFNRACDAEAIRVMKSSPAWIPGKQKGQPVKVRVTVPVKFVL
ncbi:MAG TPA: energy transducer TonB, partial [Cyclobacteriaceae bacterium]|nr:energy transducer TonB [Cyclobacteriaceae bacterium]